MKRSLIAILATVSLVLTATVAEAVIKNGTHKGKTSQGHDVSFKVSGGKKKKNGKRTARKVSNFAARANFACTDGDNFSAPLSAPSNPKFTIRNGRWGFTATRRDGAGSWAANGRTSSKSKTTGELGGQFKFNENNQLDPNGAIVCSTQATFTASK